MARLTRSHDVLVAETPQAAIALMIALLGPNPPHPGRSREVHSLHA